MPAFTEQMQIKITDLWRKTVWIVCGMLNTALIQPVNPILLFDTPENALPFKYIGSG